MNTLKLVRKLLPFLGVAILLIFLFSLDLQSLWETLSKANVSVFVILLGITTLNVLLKAWRWKLLIKKVTDQRISLWFSFTSIIAGVAAGSFIPGKVEMAKPLLLKSEKNIPFSQSLCALFIERIFDFLIIIAFLLLAVVFLPTQHVVSTTLLFIFSGVIIFLLSGVIFFPKVYTTMLKKMGSFILPKRWREKAFVFFDQFFANFSLFKHKRLTLFLLLFSLVANAVEVYRLQYLLHFFSIDVAFSTIAFTFGVAITIGILSLIPGGVGITELTIAGVLGLLLPTVASDEIKNAVLIDRIFAYYLLILVGAVILILYRKTLQKVSPEDKST